VFGKAYNDVKAVDAIAGICALGEALKVNTSLQKLDLRYAYLQEEGAYVFGDMLRVNTSLKVLNLESAQAGIASFCHMLSGVLHNPDLVVTLPFIELSACYCHPAWKREGLAIPRNQAMWFLMKIMEGGGVSELRPYFKLRCHVMSLVLNAAAACPNFGRRSAQFHYLQPPAQLGITPSKRLLELVSGPPKLFPPWCREDQRLRQLCCCCPLSTLAARLVRVNDRHEGHRIVESRATALILKRCFSVFAWWVWNTTFDSGSSRSSRWPSAFQ